MKVRCPRCGGPAEYGAQNPYRPFCSKRCKESDLFEWLKDDDEEDEKKDETSRENGKSGGSGSSSMHR